ncbi:transcriptional regulator [Metarhizobium album]|uniref:Transcriptional regulator n=1 Tax=Metarhizobium album TaxID=2182425 RepID=A0A2U2DIL0_9HYPH|nr:helix-turn-helix transcriptional regulator [Rhizobium album]PWE53146.1 transcriptional regulator [Rhizobium album]
MKSQPHAVDVQVGKKIRNQRMISGISQSELGDRIGVTFQQIQKYEKGSNRVSASRLVEIAGAMNIDVRSFFDEMEGQAANNNESVKEEFVVSRQGLLLNSAFLSIKNEAIRTKILKLVQEIASTETVAAEAKG